MSLSRVLLGDYLCDQMQMAASDARRFVDGNELRRISLPISEPSKRYHTRLEIVF